MKYDAKCCDYVFKNGRPWTAVYNNVRALVMFFLAYVVLFGEKSFISSRIVKLNGQSEMFTRVSQWATIGDALISIPS